MAIFIFTAFSLFKTLDSMVTPCSIKAKGRYFGNFPRPASKVTFCGLRTDRTADYGLTTFILPVCNNHMDNHSRHNSYRLCADSGMGRIPIYWGRYKSQMFPACPTNFFHHEYPRYTRLFFSPALRPDFCHLL